MHQALVECYSDDDQLTEEWTLTAGEQLPAAAFSAHSHHRIRAVLSNYRMLEYLSVMGAALPSSLKFELIIERVARWRPPMQLRAVDPDRWVGATFELDFYERRSATIADSLETYTVRRLGSGWELELLATSPIGLGEVTTALLLGFNRSKLSADTQPTSSVLGNGSLHASRLNQRVAGRDDQVRELTASGQLWAGTANRTSDMAASPIGFLRYPDGGASKLTVDVETDKLLLVGPGAESVLNPSLEENLIEDLRQMTEVELDSEVLSREDGRESVFRLALAGVPIVTPGSSLARPDLGYLRAARRKSEPEDSHISREARSVLLRRDAWREARARATRPALKPSLSVVLATMRPENLEFALSQLSQQTVAGEIELVLAAHGFNPHEELKKLPDELTRCVSVAICVDSSEYLGSVLNKGVQASSGTLVARWDDDDLYGPCFLEDLLTARMYSQADLIGFIADFIYLHDYDTTIRRPAYDDSERFSSDSNSGLTSGAATLVTRDALIAAGGFRALPRFEDGELTAHIRGMGGSVYIAHALNSVYVRASAGHNYPVPLKHHLRQASHYWSGLYLNGAYLADTHGVRPEGAIVDAVTTREPKVWGPQSHVGDALRPDRPS